MLKKDPGNIVRAKKTIVLLNKINPEFSLKEQTMKFSLSYFEHIIQSSGSVEKPVKLEKIEGKRTRGQPTARYMNSLAGEMSALLEDLKIKLETDHLGEKLCDC